MTDARPRADLIVNLRSTQCPASLEPLAEALAPRWRVHTVPVEEPSRFEEAVKRSADEARLLFIASGDGTLGRSANALVRAGLPVGVIPIGNANDLARGLGVPLDPLEACEALTRARLHRIDLGRANGHGFFNAVTIGIGAAVSRGLDVSTKRRFRRLGQLLRLKEAVQERRPFRAEITDSSGVSSVRSVHIAVGNGRTHGGGLVVGEGARLDDARLALSSVPPSSLWRLAALAPSLVAGRRSAHPRIHTLSDLRFRIQTDRPLDVATDGDVVTRTPVEIESVSGALEVLVPDPTEAPAVEATPR